MPPSFGDQYVAIVVYLNLSMALSTQPYKGARDFYPEDKRLQKWMFDTMRKVVESFGFEEYDAPLLEPLEIYAAKTGDEIVNEQTYTFEDRGKRKVVIRPEMTPSVSRMVAAKRQELAYPLRLYNVGNRWRYERPQRGRVREFWQLDADLFGVDGLSAEFEVIQAADKIMQSFSAKRDMYTIRLNSRKLMDSLLTDYLGLGKQATQDLSKLIDRMHKLEEHHFDAQLAVIAPKSESKVKKLLQARALDDLPDDAKNSRSAKELEKLTQMLSSVGITNAGFDITLMRGFDYYTDIVFEVFDNHPENNRAMFGGGRYSGLVGLFGAEPIEAVGFGMGDVTLQNFLEAHKLLPSLKPATKLNVLLVGDIFQDAQKLIAELRKLGINVAVDTSDRKLDKQLKNAVKSGVRYALVIGGDELKSGKLKLKDLEKSTEKTVTLNDIKLIISQ